MHTQPLAEAFEPIKCGIFQCISYTKEDYTPVFVSFSLYSVNLWKTKWDCFQKGPAESSEINGVTRDIRVCCGGVITRNDDSL